MTISREEAEASLRAISATAAQLRALVASGSSYRILILWGCIWIVGYGATQFMPPQYLSYLWMVLVAVGIAMTLVISRRAAVVRSPIWHKIWYGWLALLAFALFWAWLIAPFISITDEGHFWRHFGVITASLPMFGYVLMGLWLDSRLTWLGLIITALAAAGSYLVPGYFWLWMAVTGGGSLIGTGLYIRNAWRDADA